MHKSEDAVPYTKGEGALQMVADFVSADHGWLRSPNGSAEAQVLFKADKNRDGYFSNEEILDQANKAMDILKDNFLDEDHILAYDNARTHLKRASNALSTRHMPKKTSKPGSNWGVEVTAKDAEGKESSHYTLKMVIRRLGYSKGWPLSLRNEASSKNPSCGLNAKISNALLVLCTASAV